MEQPHLFLLLSSLLMTCGYFPLETKSEAAAQPSTSSAVQASDSFEDQVADYIRRYPYQQTYDYAVRFTGGDPARLNTWALPGEPAFVRAGQDIVPRTNNDTYYQAATLWLEGTVTVTFKRACEPADVNCLSVPAGRFDLVARYFLPHREIITGEWTFPKIRLLAD